jgi:TPP-dependent 2-oxoacid decarboxylase
VELDSEGTLYYTPAWETSLYTLKADGTEEILYEGELMTPMRYLTFHDKTMYIVYPGWGDVGMVMSAYIGVQQAPNHGLD